jgi:hypothetical protein
LFAFSTPLTLEKLTEHYVELIITHGIGRHIDIVLVLNKGVIMLAGKMPKIEGWAPLVLQGFGGDQAEGAHIAAALIRAGDASLDLFLRILLGRLIHFRPMVGHPGFMWHKPDAPGEMMLTYLTSITTEKDPMVREKKLRAYADEVRADFGRSSSPAPADTAPTKTDLPSVIYLPDQSASATEG